MRINLEPNNYINEIQAYNGELTKKKETFHYRKERYYRKNTTRFLIASENAKVHRQFIVTYNTNEESKRQIHRVYTNGVIEVWSLDGAHITDMIGRPAQLRRYYDSINEHAPKKMIELATFHRGFVDH